MLRRLPPAELLRRLPTISVDFRLPNFSDDFRPFPMTSDFRTIVPQRNQSEGSQTIHLICMTVGTKLTPNAASYESYIILRDRIVELAWSKVSTKVCGFKFGSIKLHLTSKRIKEILTQKRQYNWK